MASVDLLVVGAGLAGMSAALEAAEQGASVLLASGQPGSSGLAQGGIAAAVGDGDSPALHARDTVAAGAGLCDAAAVESVTGEAAATVEWLAAQGVAFDLDGAGRLRLGLEAAHTLPKVLRALREDVHVIAVPEPVAARARLALERMVSLG